MISMKRFFSILLILFSLFSIAAYGAFSCPDELDCSNVRSEQKSCHAMSIEEKASLEQSVVSCQIHGMEYSRTISHVQGPSGQPVLRWICKLHLSIVTKIQHNRKSLILPVKPPDYPEETIQFLS